MICVDNRERVKSVDSDASFTLLRVADHGLNSARPRKEG